MASHKLFHKNSSRIYTAVNVSVDESFYRFVDFTYEQAHIFLLKFHEILTDLLKPSPLDHSCYEQSHLYNSLRTVNLIQRGHFLLSRQPIMKFYVMPFEQMVILG